MARKVWSESEKLAVVLEMLQGKSSASEIFTRHGVNPTQAYKWRDAFMEGGKKGLADKRTQNGRDPAVEENRRLKEMVGSQALVIDTQKKFLGLS